MSSYRVIARVSQILRETIWSEIENSNETEKNEISFNRQNLR